MKSHAPAPAVHRVQPRRRYRRSLAGAALVLAVLLWHTIMQSALWLVGFVDSPLGASAISVLALILFLAPSVHAGWRIATALRHGNLRFAQSVGARSLRADSPDPRVRLLLARVAVTAKQVGLTAAPIVVVLQDEPDADALLVSAGAGRSVLMLTRGTCAQADTPSARQVIAMAIAGAHGTRAASDRDLLPLLAAVTTIDRLAISTARRAALRQDRTGRALAGIACVLSVCAVPSLWMALLLRGIYLPSPSSSAASGAWFADRVARLSRPNANTLRGPWRECLRHRTVAAMTAPAVAPTPPAKAPAVARRSGLRPELRFATSLTSLTSLRSRTIAVFAALRPARLPTAMAGPPCAGLPRERDAHVDRRGLARHDPSAPLDASEFAVSTLVAATLSPDGNDPVSPADLRYVLTGTDLAGAERPGPDDRALARRLAAAGDALRDAARADDEIDRAVATLNRTLSSRARRVLVRRLECRLGRAGRLDHALADRAWLARLRRDLDVPFPKLIQTLDRGGKGLGARRAGHIRALGQELTVLFDAGARLVEPVNGARAARVAAALGCLGVEPVQTSAGDDEHRAAGLDHALSRIAAQPVPIRAMIWREAARLLADSPEAAIARRTSGRLAHALALPPPVQARAA